MSSWQKVKKRGIKKDKYIDLEIEGVFIMSSNGFAFVKDTNHNEVKEVFISKSQTEYAINGDYVKVKIIDKTSKGYDGKIINVIHRKYNKIYAIINHIFKGNFILYSPILGRSKSIYCTPYSNECLVEVGDRVKVEILSWGTCNHDIHGKILENYGNINDKSKDLDSIISENNLNIVKNNIERNNEEGSYVNLNHFNSFSFNNTNIAYSLYKEGNIYNLFVHLPDISNINNIESIFNNIKYNYRDINLKENTITYLNEDDKNLLKFKTNENNKSITLKYCINEDNYDIITINVFKSNIYLNKIYNKIIDLENKEFSNLYKKIIDNNRNNKYEFFSNIESKFLFNGVDNYDFNIFNLILQKLIINKIDNDNLIYSNIQLFELIKDNDNIKLNDKNIYSMLESNESNNKDFNINNLINYNKQKTMSYSRVINNKDNIFSFINIFEPLDNIVSLINLNNIINNQSNLFTDLLCYKINKVEKIISKIENDYFNLQKIRYFAELKEDSFNVIITKIRPYAIFFIHKETLYEDSIHVSNLGGKRYNFNNIKNILISIDNKIKFETGEELLIKIEKIDLVKREIKWIYET